MVVVNIPIDIREVADEPAPQDALLGVYELQEFRSVPPFSGMKPGPENFPGAMILRRVHRGRVLCHQGDPGRTAFQILTQPDALNVLKALRRSVDAEAKAIRDALAAGVTPETSADERERLLRRDAAEAPLRTLRAARLDEEIQQLEAAVAKLPPNTAPRVVAQARLLVAPPGNRRGLLRRLINLLPRFGAAPASRSKLPDYIPNDGPQDLSAGTLSAPMFEGDLFGEMSCMNLAPRSATVIATEGTPTEPVYMIEMVRNALDALRGNAEYRRRMDEIYRTRVMETQVRSLPLFRCLSDADYKWLSSQLDLVEFGAGDVIFDEHDSATDFCYVVRNGVVKVSRGLGCLLGPDEIRSPAVLLQELQIQAHQPTLPPTITQLLQPLLDSLPATPADAPKFPETLRKLLNQWIRTADLQTKIAATTDELLERSGLRQYSAAFTDFQEKTADWWELEARIFHRVLLDSLCPKGLKARTTALQQRRTLSYASRGELIGEIALLRGEERSATCLAFTHPSSGQKTATQANLIPQRVEAVRISADTLRALMERSPAFRRHVDETIRQRQDRDQQVAVQASTETVAAQSPEFESLGLAWGQSLMVIDLDRCTRCQECVKACVAAHDDGRTRLYLDGPRFESRYLIPVSCRQCLDPVCMIGCPVGAINRGSSGEIRIADHCIGCSKCADQCPYGSIQMDLLDSAHEPDADLASLLGPGYVLRSVQERAVVCDQCKSTPSGKPSCVYACPHEAAIRVEGLKFFENL
ncbi:MAG: 4Fe-4S binding protein [Planctomyces sp.]|jgi:Fe-S-cluster-containing hydrogenase component 2/CRP-like cAMP-binding protein